jgi:hypothetical protein
MFESAGPFVLTNGASGSMNLKGFPRKQKTGAGPFQAPAPA